MELVAELRAILPAYRHGVSILRSSQIARFIGERVLVAFNSVMQGIAPCVFTGVHNA